MHQAQRIQRVVARRQVHRIVGHDRVQMRVRRVAALRQQADQVATSEMPSRLWSSFTTSTAPTRCW